MNKISHYNGGKNGNGTYQTIINHIPPHKKYVEPFLGSGAIYYNKLPALISILNDKDQNIMKSYGDDAHLPTGVIINCMDASVIINQLSEDSSDTFIYCDPPYLMETRTSKRRLYKYEMTETD